MKVGCVIVCFFKGDVEVGFICIINCKDYVIMLFKLILINWV